MIYDSAGSKDQFVSSGMCEIKALKDSLPVFVNPAHKPVVHPLSNDTDTAHHIYYFDTVQGHWKYEGEMVITDATCHPACPGDARQNNGQQPGAGSADRPRFFWRVQPVQ
jgi:hypothetical protein